MLIFDFGVPEQVKKKKHILWCFQGVLIGNVGVKLVKTFFATLPSYFYNSTFAYGLKSFFLYLAQNIMG